MSRQININGRLFDFERATHLASIFERANGTFISPPFPGGLDGRYRELYRGQGGAYVMLTTDDLGDAGEMSRGEAKTAFNVGEQHVTWKEAFPEDANLPLA